MGCWGWAVSSLWESRFKYLKIPTFQGMSLRMNISENLRMKDQDCHQNATPQKYNREERARDDSTLCSSMLNPDAFNGKIYHNSRSAAAPLYLLAVEIILIIAAPLRLFCWTTMQRRCNAPIMTMSAPSWCRIGAHHDYRNAAAPLHLDVGYGSQGWFPSVLGQCWSKMVASSANCRTCQARKGTHYHKMLERVCASVLRAEGGQPPWATRAVCDETEYYLFNVQLIEYTILLRCKIKLERRRQK